MANEGGARHRDEFSVRTYETDQGGRLRLAALLDYFQEAAGRHAETLGAGVIELHRRNLTWVISRYHIRISRYPRWKERLLLTTWPSGNKNLFALREFEVKDGSEKPVAAATSSWMLVDLGAKRPVSPAETLGPYPQDSGRAVDSAFEPLPSLSKVDRELVFRVRLGDLDWNRHVNHVVYAEWALEAVPPDLLETSRPAEVEIDFRGQAFYGESVVSRCEVAAQGDDHVTYHAVRRENPEKELARVRIRWRK